MKYTSLFFLMLILCFSFLSCNENEEPKTVENNELSADTEETNVMDAQFSADVDAFVNKESEPVKYMATGVKLSPDILAGYLPPNIPGFSRKPDSRGVSGGGNSEWTTASCLYLKNNGKGFFELRISDHGAKQHFPNAKYIDNPPSDPTFEISPLQLKNGKGYFAWNNVADMGEIHSLFFDRIAITINADRVDNDTNFIKNVLNLIEINKLESEIKKISK